MASLVIKFADLASEPVGSGNDVTAEVLVSYTREVPLADGTVLQAVPTRKQLGAGGTAIFEVTPSDDPTVVEAHRGFGLRVEWILTHRAGRGRQTETRGARTVKVIAADGATVQFGTLLPAEPLPPQYASITDVVDDVRDAKLSFLASMWDGPVTNSATEPSDKTTLWFNDGVAKQYIPGLTGGNLARQTATHATTGWVRSPASDLYMSSGRVTTMSGSSTPTSIRLMDPARGATVATGQTITMAADLGGGGGGHTSTYALRLCWFNSAGTLFASETSDYRAPVLTGDRYAVTATAPSGAVSACAHTVGSGAPGVAAEIWITNVSVTTDGTSTYVGGDTPGYQWTGEPGLSTTEPAAPEWQTVSTVDELIRKRVTLDGADIADAVAPVIAAAPDHQLGHDVRRATLRRRRGGPIGVGDKQVIAVRLDHGVQEAHDKGILAALADLDIPYHLCMCPEPNPSVVAEAPVPWDVVRSAAATGGAEVGNHSRTHALDASGTDALTSEIVGGLTGVQAQVPDQAIEVWTQPGLSESGTMYDGWKHGRDVESITTTEAGRLILGHHGAVMGALSQQYWMPLDGTEAVGLAAWFADGKRPYQVQNHVTAARSHTPALGGVIAMHPAWIDRGGSYQTAAECIEWLTWLAAERDAGRVELLTHAGLSIATTRDEQRAALAVTSGPAPITATPHQGAMGSLARAPYGAVWQAVATVTATSAGDVTLTAECGTTTTATTVTLAADETATLRRHVLLPLTATATPTATVTGPATVTDLRLQAV